MATKKDLKKSTSPAKDVSPEDGALAVPNDFLLLEELDNKSRKTLDMAFSAGG